MESTDYNAKLARAAQAETRFLNEVDRRLDLFGEIVTAEFATALLDQIRQVPEFRAIGVPIDENAPLVAVKESILNLLATFPPDEVRPAKPAETGDATATT